MAVKKVSLGDWITVNVDAGRPVIVTSLHVVQPLATSVDVLTLPLPEAKTAVPAGLDDSELYWPGVVGKVWPAVVSQFSPSLVYSSRGAVPLLPARTPLT